MHIRAADLPELVSEQILFIMCNRWVRAVQKDCKNKQIEDKHKPYDYQRDELCDAIL
jgi:hypothetical protein